MPGARFTAGKKKGKFVKQKVKDHVDKFLKETKGKQGRYWRANVEVSTKIYLH